MLSALISWDKDNLKENFQPELIQGCNLFNLISR